MKQLWTILAFAATISACQQAPTSTKLHIDFEGASEAISIGYTTAGGVEYEQQDITLNEHNQLIHEFDTEHPFVVYVRHGESSSSLLVEPGNNTPFRWDVSDADNEIQSGFSQVYGKASGLYFNDENKERYDYQMRGTTDSFMLLFGQVDARADSILNALMAEHQLNELERQFVQSQQLSTKNYLKRIHAYYSKSADMRIFDEFADLDYSNPVHRAVWTISDVMETRRHLAGDTTPQYSVDQQWQARAQYFPNAELQEEAHAYNIVTYASSIPYPSLDSLVTRFKAQYPQSGYLDKINSKHAFFASLQPGMPAKNIEGITVDGQAVDFTDFQGQVLYVDFWATWCGPCRREHPHLDTFLRQRADNPNVQVLTVSIDAQQSHWEEWMNNEEKHLPGNITEVLVDTTKNWSVIQDSYGVRGIPHYLLIGADGNIIDASAPRPSQKKKLNELVDKALNS